MDFHLLYYFRNDLQTYLQSNNMHGSLSIEYDTPILCDENSAIGKHLIVDRVAKVKAARKLYK